MRRCSVCNKKATKEIRVIWKGIPGKDNYPSGWVPRCDKHIVKGYKGKIRKIKNEI